MKILLLEDEYSLRVSIEEFLVDLGYDVHSYKNGEEAFDAIFSIYFDLLLLDVNVPGMNGFDFLKSARKEKIEIPTIFMTARTQMQDFKEGYDCGCCDYIRKPFDLMELQLRIAQACKSFYFENTDTLDFGDSLVYDTKAHKLLYKDEEIVLSKTEHDIFELLLRYQDKVVPITSFQDEIWGEYVDPANVRVQINNLRKKLPLDIIKNRRGVGYIIEQ